jgi:hypothetical protein
MPAMPKLGELDFVTFDDFGASIFINFITDIIFWSVLQKVSIFVI